MRLTLAKEHRRQIVLLHVIPLVEYLKVDYAGPSPLNTNNLMDYITIASAGNAVDWGDFVDSGSQTMGNMSDSHGGLGGF